MSQLRLCLSLSGLPYIIYPLSVPRCAPPRNSRPNSSFLMMPTSFSLPPHEFTPHDIPIYELIMIALPSLRL
ncbi:hypothetical protein M430DRAFT_211864 [Amorphotheca resinae ATCC 22711]|uniref:Uncharacterized protein n=1 Tax=Amorphotheca resinae ATCC 22711 TaxID=857342 RepID=A0A2T3B809_AMORE|nr:hypothetical protein M430DRAFT_211864 [Amorphotheca resinae ATCC 22711]PSS22993.1 hypothetical protein M430DRAFT_211864 [Amorphotheca resinae ATCC 22711]